MKDQERKQKYKCKYKFCLPDSTMPCWEEIQKRIREQRKYEPRYYYSHDTLWDGDPEK